MMKKKPFNICACCHYRLLLAFHKSLFTSDWIVDVEIENHLSCSQTIYHKVLPRHERPLITKSKPRTLGAATLDA